MNKTQRTDFPTQQKKYKGNKGFKRNVSPKRIPVFLWQLKDFESQEFTGIHVKLTRTSVPALFKLNS